jgi:hypothetical protein
MSKNRPKGNRAFSMRVLVLGFAFTLVMAVAAVTLVVVELGRAQERTLVLADEGQHTTYYLGDVGERLARLRAQIALGLQETPEQFRARGAAIADRVAPPRGHRRARA